MSKQIFRVPVDVQHFEATIVKGKPYSQLFPFLHEEERKRLLTLSTPPDGILRYWGSLPGSNNLRTFREIEKGDEILFYRGGKYIGVATIGYATTNPELARHSWSENSKGDTWELMYFFSHTALIAVTTATLNEQWGMKGGHVMGFSKLSDERAQPFIRERGSVAAFLNQIDKR